MDGARRAERGLMWRGAALARGGRAGAAPAQGRRQTSWSPPPATSFEPCLPAHMMLTRARTLTHLLTNTHGRTHTHTHTHTHTQKHTHTRTNTHSSSPSARHPPADLPDPGSSFPVPPARPYHTVPRLVFPRRPRDAHPNLAERALTRGGAAAPHTTAGARAEQRYRSAPPPARTSQWQRSAARPLRWGS